MAKSGRFGKVQQSVAAGYEKKGMTAAQAEKIGGAVAAKQGRKKYGAAGMAALAAKGRKKGG